MHLQEAFWGVIHPSVHPASVKLVTLSGLARLVAVPANLMLTA